MPEARTPKTIEGVINGYVERGIFRSLKESEEDGVTVYRFSWLSEFHRITLAYDPNGRTLTFVRLFPALPDDVYAHVEHRVSKRTDPEAKIPEHRRIPPGTGTPALVREEGDATLRLTIGPENDEANALQLLVNLANDLIFDLQLRFPAYTYDHFAQIDD